MHATTKTRMGIPTEKLGKEYKQIILRKKVGQSLSCIWLFAAPWTVACQAPLSMGFYRQEYWSGLPFPSPGHLPDPGIEPVSLESAALAGRFSTTSATWGPPSSSVARSNSWRPLGPGKGFLSRPWTLSALGQLPLRESMSPESPPLE